MLVTMASRSGRSHSLPMVNPALSAASAPTPMAGQSSATVWPLPNSPLIPSTRAARNVASAPAKSISANWLTPVPIFVINCSNGVASGFSGVPLTPEVNAIHPR